jgi:hypothetical protein
MGAAGLLGICRYPLSGAPRALFAPALLCISLGTNGCATLLKTYIHDDASQKAAESAQAGWKAADPGKVLDLQKAYFAQLAADEAVTVKSSITARRDLQLISLIRGDNHTVTELRQRLTALVGGAAIGQVAALDEKISQTRTRIDLNTLSLGNARQQLARDGFRDDVSDCSKITNPLVLDPNADQHTIDLGEVGQACADLQHASKDLDGLLSSITTGALGETIQQLAALQRELKSEQARESDLANALRSLKDQVDNAKDPPTVEAAKAVLKFCGADPSSSASAAAASPASAARASAAIASSSEAAMLGKAMRACASKTEPLVQQMRHSQLADEIQSVLTTVLNANTVAGKTTIPANRNIASSTTTALKTLSFLTPVADDIEQGRVPSVNALLVALAYEQHLVAMNQLAVQTLKERIVLYEDKREALIGESAHLARALQKYPRSPGKDEDMLLHDLLKKGSVGAGVILTEIASSWNVGRYRVELAEYADIDLTRRDSLGSATEVAESWKNVLQPAFDELVAYGDGGLDAQTLSSLAAAIVNAGGFTAVAARLR